MGSVRVTECECGYHKVHPGCDGDRECRSHATLIKHITEKNILIAQL